MAKVGKRRIDLGTGADQINGNVIPSTYTPGNYTPSSSDLDGHFSGINDQIGEIHLSTDITHTNVSLSNNQSTYSNISGLSFANGEVRSAIIVYSIEISATTSLFEEGELFLIQKGSDWFISRRSNGDDSLVDFDVSASGQVQYKSPNYTGFSSAKINFRAITTEV